MASSSIRKPTTLPLIYKDVHDLLASTLLPHLPHPFVTGQGTPPLPRGLCPCHLLSLKCFPPSHSALYSPLPPNISPIFQIPLPACKDFFCCCVCCCIPVSGISDWHTVGFQYRFVELISGSIGAREEEMSQVGWLLQPPRGSPDRPEPAACTLSPPLNSRHGHSMPGRELGSLGPRLIPGSRGQSN